MVTPRTMLTAASLASVVAVAVGGLSLAPHTTDEAAVVTVTDDTRSPAPAQASDTPVPTDAHSQTAERAEAEASDPVGSVPPLRNVPTATPGDAPAQKKSQPGKAAKGETKKSAGKSGRAGAQRPAESTRASAHSGKFVANFVFAHSSVSANAQMVRAMNADAITFGYRVTPAKKSSYPAAVQKAIGKKKVYAYSGGIQWAKGALSAGDATIGRHTLVQVGKNAVVIVTNDADPQRALIQGAHQAGGQAFLGMPAPQMKGYLPDLSYRAVMEAFTKKFVKNYASQGADGWYHHIEMPVGGKSTWDGVRGYYSMQNQIVNSVDPGATTIIAPYLEARKTKASATPAQTASGVKKLLATAKGTNLIIAPQDGLGTGTTALAQDRRSGYVAPAEEYFQAMRSVAGKRLYVTTEAMRPGGGTPQSRTATTAQRVGEQLSALAPYTSGSIGFMWNNTTGMKNISGIGSYAAGRHTAP